MTTTPKQDDYDAVRALVETLEPFESKDRLRIIKWACEKLEIPLATSQVQNSIMAKVPSVQADRTAQPNTNGSVPLQNIKSFIESKSPKSDRQFATVVAYYYRFEAPQEQRKDLVNSNDLQEAARMSNHGRFRVPAQTLGDAARAGYLDNMDHGMYRLNTVGENLVAMVLPGDGKDSSTKGHKPIKKKAVRGKAKKGSK